MSDTGIILTKDAQGNPNGWVQPLWNSLTSGYRPAQVYLTALYPGASKGPHLHLRRRGRFSCVQGEVLVVLRYDKNYIAQRIYPGSEAQIVLPGVACELRNLRTDMISLVVNMPRPAWSPDEPDEHPVEDWNPPL